MSQQPTSQQAILQQPTLYELLSGALLQRQPVALATVVECSENVKSTSVGDKLLVFPVSEAALPETGAQPDPTIHGSLGNLDLTRIVARDALGELAAARTGVRHYGPDGQQREEDVAVFIESFAPPPRMIIFGAVDFTAALAKVAKTLGYAVTVCDARAIFATRQRFPMADEVIVAWPDEMFDRFQGGSVSDKRGGGASTGSKGAIGTSDKSGVGMSAGGAGAGDRSVATSATTISATSTLGPRLGANDAVCILTHDPKFDIPAVIRSLETNVGYIGAMGSRRTHAKRVELLKEAGVTDEQLKRVMAPIGLDIGARSPEETAISVVAEIIALRTSTPAPSLRDSEGPIHR